MLAHHLTLVLLFFTGLIAATVDAIAGGGGLICLPMLLAVGMPPHIALGTNKLQSSCGTAIATYSYYQRGWISFQTIYKGLVFGFVGAVLGSWLGQLLSNDLLKKIIPVLLFIILLYTLFSTQKGDEDHPPRMKEFWFYIIFGFTLGFYDGVFGPATGSFWVFSLIFFLGYNMTKASAYAKVFNLKSNLIATVCFALGSNIDYRIALCMATGQIIGGRLGAHLAMRNGARLIRPLFISVVSVTVLGLAYQYYGAAEIFSKLEQHFVVLISALLLVTLGGFLIVIRKRKSTI